MQMASCQLCTFDFCMCSLALALPQSGGRDYDLGEHQRWESISGTAAVHQCIVSCAKRLHSAVNTLQDAWKTSRFEAGCDIMDARERRLIDCRPDCIG